jgi:asparagine synthase (glutamine-hydrolysing)
MCGFAGFIANNNLDEISNIEILRQMSNEIIHRGPDDNGIFYDNESRIGLSHRRLSIIDKSDAGKQPMTSKNYKYIIVFNGEIYNHIELRDFIKLNNFTINWNGHSDTETLLELISIFGINESLNMCVGMFAFALWDTELKELILARDRFGEKPLYYGWQGIFNNSCFIFGSDLNSFKKNPLFDNIIDPDSIQSFMQYSYIPTPSSIYKNIYKLEPGNTVRVSLKNKTPILNTYWSTEYAINNSKKNLFQGNFDNAVSELESLLKKSISNQMIADVPIGAFLSGGIDSSLIVALMQSQSKTKIKTFTIGFKDSIFNEANYAKEIAKHLDTDHNELYLSSSDAINIIPSLSSIYSEPFADSSQIPTILVSKFAKTQVTVSLSGDAGDELFAGYNRYLLINKYFKYFNKYPILFNKYTSNLLQYVPSSFYNSINFFTSNTKVDYSHKIKKAATLFQENNVINAYSKIITHWNTEQIVKNHSYTPIIAKSINSLNNIENMMYNDTNHYLLDDILTKVDRASMSVSLESRIPFLDHRVFEFAWKLPIEMKIYKNEQKFILKEILNKYVPKKLYERPKMGFGIPLENWLKGPLRDWCEDLLTESKIEQDGFLNSKLIKKTWNEFTQSKNNHQYRIWNVLMFQSWLEQNRK